MGWLGELLLAAGPWAGYVLAGTLAGLGLWLYATDRLVSRGRHAEQATHYEQVLAQQQAAHAAQLDQLRSHMEQLLSAVHTRAEQLLEDRNYWRDVGLDSLNTLSASVGRSTPSQAGGEGATR